MAEIEISEATSSEAPVLARLRAAWTDEPDQTSGESFGAEFKAWFEKEFDRRVFWLARLAGEPVGMVNLVLFRRMPRPGGHAGVWGYLGNMFVVKEHRDRGVGRRLIDELLAYADDNRLERIVVNPTRRSIPFYRRHGFESGEGLMVRLRQNP